MSAKFPWGGAIDPPASSLYHFLFVCIYYDSLRKQFLPDYFENYPSESKEGRALTGFSGPPQSEKIKVAAQYFILRVLIDE